MFYFSDYLKDTFPVWEPLRQWQKGGVSKHCSLHGLWAAWQNLRGKTDMSQSAVACQSLYELCCGSHRDNSARLAALRTSQGLGQRQWSRPVLLAEACCCISGSLSPNGNGTVQKEELWKHVRIPCAAHSWRSRPVSLPVTEVAGGKSMFCKCRLSGSAEALRGPTSHLRRGIFHFDTHAKGSTFWLLELFVSWLVRKWKVNNSMKPIHFSQYIMAQMCKRLQYRAKGCHSKHKYVNCFRKSNISFLRPSESWSCTILLYFFVCVCLNFIRFYSLCYNYRLWYVARKTW